MGKRTAVHRNVDGFGLKPKAGFWQNDAGRSLSCYEKDHEDHTGVLALELQMQTCRLEPIMRRSPVYHGFDRHDAGISRPSAHWRGIFQYQEQTTPVHHLFTLPSACAAPRSISSKSAETESMPPLINPARPVSCPSSLRTSIELPNPDNVSVSYIAFRTSLAAVKTLLQLPHTEHASHVPVGNYSCDAVARSGHVPPLHDSANSNLPSTFSSFLKKRTEHEPMQSRWTTSVDLSHGAQGVVSKLRGQMHGPGPCFRSMPVTDLTSSVPIRKGQHPQNHPTSKTPKPVTPSAAFPFTGDSHRPFTQPQRAVSPRGQSSPSVAKMPLQSLMTAVHEVSEVLHVLRLHHKDLSEALWQHLISWSSDMAQKSNFVAELDFTVPKVIVEKAHQMLSSQQQYKKASLKAGRAMPKHAALERPKKVKDSRWQAQGGVVDLPPGHLSHHDPSCPNTLRSFTPPLKVKGFPKPAGCDGQSTMSSPRQESPVPVAHVGTTESVLEVLGVQVLNEPALEVWEEGVSLKGLVCNHAQGYLVPHSPETGLRGAVSPRVGRSETPKPPSSGVSASPRTQPGATENVNRASRSSQREKRQQMEGWDHTDRGILPPVSAYHCGESGSLISDAHVATPVEEVCSTNCKELWDYVGQGSE